MSHHAAEPGVGEFGKVLLHDKELLPAQVDADQVLGRLQFHQTLKTRRKLFNILILSLIILTIVGTHLISDK